MACNAQGQGTIKVVERSTPFWSARKMASLTAWHIPKSSALIISRRASAGYPSRRFVWPLFNRVTLLIFHTWLFFLDNPFLEKWVVLRFFRDGRFRAVSAQQACCRREGEDLAADGFEQLRQNCPLVSLFAPRCGKKSGRRIMLRRSQPNRRPRARGCGLGCEEHGAFAAPRSRPVGA